MLNAVFVTPGEERVVFFLNLLDFGILEPVLIVLARFGRLGYTFNSVEELQEAEVCLDVHTNSNQSVNQSIN